VALLAYDMFIHCARTLATDRRAHNIYTAVA